MSHNSPTPSFQPPQCTEWAFNAMQLQQQEQQAWEDERPLWTCGKRRRTIAGWFAKYFTHSHSIVGRLRLCRLGTETDQAKSVSHKAIRSVQCLHRPNTSKWLPECLPSTYVTVIGDNSSDIAMSDGTGRKAATRNLFLGDVFSLSFSFKPVLPFHLPFLSPLAFRSLSVRCNAAPLNPAKVWGTVVPAAGKRQHVFNYIVFRKKVIYLFLPYISHSFWANFTKLSVDIRK